MPLIYFLAGVLFMYLMNLIELFISMIQSKVNVYTTKKQAEINQLALEDPYSQQGSSNIGFVYEEPEEEYYDDYDDDYEEYD